MDFTFDIMEPTHAGQTEHISSSTTPHLQASIPWRLESPATQTKVRAACKDQSSYPEKQITPKLSISKQRSLPASPRFLLASFHVWGRLCEQADKSRIRPEKLQIHCSYCHTERIKGMSLWLQRQHSGPQIEANHVSQAAASSIRF